MLIGEYQHTVDLKGRVNFPAKFREDIGERFIVTKGLDQCLFVYSEPEWATLEEKIKSQPMSKSRNIQRFLFASACEVEADKQGRIVIPQNLREYAGIQKDVMIIGASVRAEIWDLENWNRQCEDITPEMIASAMDELGF